MHANSDITIAIILIGIFVVIVFILIREINCWYWKINERILLLEDIKIELEKLNLTKTENVGVNIVSTEEKPQ